MRGFTPEQVLILADEFCAEFGCEVRDYAALVSIAAVSNPKLHTVEVFPNPSAAARYLSRHVRTLSPLSGLNERFAGFVVNAFTQWNLR